MNAGIDTPAAALATPSATHRADPGADVHGRLRRTFAQARQPPARRHHDIARLLGVSEGELVAAHATRFDAQESPLIAQRLKPAWPAIVQALEALGEVTALTRNAACVHEKVGTYRNTSVSGQVGLVLGGGIDLRLYYGAWAHGFAVQEATARGPQRSLQFFDAQGRAVHKVFLRDDSALAAYRALVARFADTACAAPGIAVQPALPAPPEAADGDIDVAAFQAAWASLRDTHGFFRLLRRHGVSRTQALRLASPEFALPVDSGAAQEVLSRAAQAGTPIMVFVGNPGMVQIHGGPVQRVEVMGPWLNVLDPGFNLHLCEDHIASAWLVRRPTTDGLVSSLELFDAEGRTIAMLFGERKPGQAERCGWRRILADCAVESGARALPRSGAGAAPPA
jgi:putative hemin transport protein